MNTSSQHLPTYTLPDGNPVIKGERAIYDYDKYRKAYKAAVGVYPEFDRVHKPTCAAVLSKIIDPEDLEEAKRASTKQGIIEIVTTGVKGGIAVSESNQVPWQRPLTDASEALIPDASGHLLSLMSEKNGQLFPLLKKEYATVMEKYRIFYSAVALAAEDYEAILDMPEGEYFSTPELGWRKKADGSYAEGTWKDGKLLCGLMYLPDFGFVAGSIDHEQLIYDGVWALETGEWLMGCVDATALEMNCDRGVRLITENGALFLQVGRFSHNRPDGFVLEMLINANGVIQMSDTKYDFGEVVKATAAERKERKQKYGSSLGSRALGYYRNILFLIVAVVLAVMSFSEGLLYLAVAIPFGLIGGLGLLSTIKKSKKQKDFKS